MNKEEQKARAEARKKEVDEEIAKHLNECYEYAKEVLKDQFERVMAEISAEILLLQGQCKDETASFAAVGMLMSLPDEDDPDSGRMFGDDVDTGKIIRAAIVWYKVDQKMK